MRQKALIIVSVLLCCLTSAVATAATSPAQVVRQFINEHLKGQFAAARGLALEQANFSTSLFSGWLFGPSGGRGDAATADIFLSRKFTQAFQYKVTGTTANGENQVQVAVIRSSPNLIHLYTWALAPKRGAPPYELIEAIDTYLTKVNFPVETSHMQFTLIRDTEEWYISSIHDEKFAQLLLQLQSQQPLSAATPPPPASAPPAASANVAHQPVNPNLPPPPMAAPPTSTTTSNDAGRQMADDQFNATLQSFNSTYQPVYSQPPPAQQAEEKPSFMSRIFGFKRKKAPVDGSSLQAIFKTIRHALQGYAVMNEGWLPSESDIYDWRTLRAVVNENSGKREQALPATEAEAGISFVRYRTVGTDDYRLTLELHDTQDGTKRVVIDPHGVERVG